MSTQRENILEKSILFWVVVVFSVWSLLPIAWMIRMSFMRKIDAFSIPPVILFEPVIRHYSGIFSRSYFGGRFFRYFANSTIVAAGATLLSVSLGTMGGYSLSRYSFRGDRLIAFLIIASRMMPPIAFAVPLFLMVREWGIYDRYIALIIIYTAFHAPFATWMMKGFLDEIPNELIIMHTDEKPVSAEDAATLFAAMKSKMGGQS